MNNQPHPILISGMELPESLHSIVEAMSENVYHQCDESKIFDRNHGFERNVKLKTNICLVPFHLLSESDNEYDLNAIVSTIFLIFL